MTTHYEELGIPPTATDAEIKRAYRKKANETHPDKGGDAAEFAKAARAYEVLSDPERKLLYDSTGKDKQDPIEIAVQQGLLFAFNQALELPDDIEIVAAVRMGFENSLYKIADAQSKAKARKKKLTAKRKRVKTKGVVNAFHLIIDQELTNIDAHLADLKYKVEVNKACLKALKSYSDEYKAPPIPTMQDLFQSNFSFQVRP